jgi:polysaccharide biosynthesis transport protein
MGLTRILRIFLARWKTVLLVFILAGAIGLSIAHLAPVTYTASGVVMVESRADPVAGVAQIMAPNFLTTQVDVIKSSRVSNKVIKNLRLEENQTLKQQFRDSAAQGTYDEWLSRLLQQNLLAVPGRGSNVIKVSYTSLDARFSSLMANAFIAAYLDSVLEMRVEPAKRYSSFFDDRSKVLREAVEKTQSALSEFQKEKGVVSADDRQDLEITKLNELQSQLLQVQAQAIESTSRQAQSQQSADKTQEVLASGLVSGLKSEIIKQETRLLSLLAKYSDNHPQVIEARGELTDLKTKLDVETRRVTSSVSISNSINRQREADLKRALETQRAKVLTLKQTRDEISVLQRDVDGARRAYDGVQQRLTQSSLESQNQQSNISVLNSAEIPNETRSQIFAKNAAKALIVALGLALVAGFIKELFDRRVRAIEDIGRTVNLQVIGIMPGPDNKKWFSRQRPSLQQARLLRQLPASNGR